MRAASGFGAACARSKNQRFLGLFSKQRTAFLVTPKPQKKEKLS
jgi:hypothetical protein